MDLVALIMHTCNVLNYKRRYLSHCDAELEQVLEAEQLVLAELVDTAPASNATTDFCRQ